MKRALAIFGSAVLVFSAFFCGSAWAVVTSEIVMTPLPAPANYTPPAGSPVAAHGKLAVTGGKIVNQSGTAVQLKGMSFFWSNSGTGSTYYSDRVTSWLAHDWKVDIVRAAMAAESDGSQPGYTDNPDAKAANEERAVTVIEAAIRRGIYVIIDWHAHKNFESEAKTFFTKMANKYGKYPNVLYEIWNEPNKDVSGSTVSSYGGTVGKAIRDAGSDGIVIVGSPWWSARPNEVSVTGVTNVAYSMHFYANEHTLGTHGQYVRSALQAGKAVFVTEWGTTNADAKGGYNEQASTEWLNFLNTEKIGWTNWSVTHDATNVTSILNVAGTSGGWASKDLTTSGTYIRGKFSTGNATYTVTVTQPAAGGTITGGKSSYAWGETIDLTAAPKEGWELKTWKGNAKGNTVNLKERFYGINLAISAEFHECGVIKNGHFTYDTEGWGNNQGNPVASGNAVVGAGSVANSEYVVNVTTAGSSVWDVRLSQMSTTLLTTGHKYSLSFKARSDAPREIKARLTNTGYGITYGDTLTANLTSAAQSFTREFTVTRASGSGGALVFNGGDKAGKWYLSEVSLKDLGPTTSVVHAPQAAGRASWSVVGSGAALRLRGPADAGAKVALYDTRGKLVRSIAAVDGQPLNAGAVRAPAGNYVMVVRNSAGADVYTTRFSLVK